MDFFLALALIAFGVFISVEAWRMPRLEHLGVSTYEVPGIVPGLIGAIIAILGVVMFARSLWYRGWDLRGAGGAVAARFEGPGPRHLLVTLALTLGYAGGLVGTIPFWLATFLFLFFFVVIFEWPKGDTRSREPVTGGIFSVGPLRLWNEFPWQARVILGAGVLAALVSASVTVVFERIFLVRLP